MPNDSNTTDFDDSGRCTGDDDYTVSAFPALSGGKGNSKIYSIFRKCPPGGSPWTSGHLQPQRGDTFWGQPWDSGANSSCLRNDSSQMETADASFHRRRNHIIYAPCADGILTISLLDKKSGNIFPDFFIIFCQLHFHEALSVPSVRPQCRRFPVLNCSG